MGAEIPTLSISRVGMDSGLTEVRSQSTDCYYKNGCWPRAYGLSDKL